MVVGLDHVGEHGGAVIHDVVAEHHHERVVPDVLAGHGDGVAEAEGLALADVVDVGQLGEVLDLLELVVLVALGEVVLELEVPVEVVLEGPLAAAGDDEDVVDAGGHRLLHHVLDGGLVDDRNRAAGKPLRSASRLQSGLQRPFVDRGDPVGINLDAYRSLQQVHGYHKPVHLFYQDQNTFHTA